MPRASSIWVFSNPDVATEESAADHLERLGCDVLRADLRDPMVVDLKSPAQAGIALIEAINDVDLAYQAIARLDKLAIVLPTLIAVSVAGLARMRIRDGVDELILYPYVPAELYHRIRRLDWKRASYSQADKVKLGELTLDRDTREVQKSGRSIKLTKQEFELLAFLLFNPNAVHGRDVLLREVWGAGFANRTRTVDIHVRRLRQKLGDALPLQTIRGVGYQLRIDRREAANE